MNIPEKISVKTYQVGFGDCSLLTFHYSRKKRHILIDFGSSGVRQKHKPKKTHLKRIAQSIKEECNGKLHAVVASHRHSDHISGFGKDVGAIIEECRPGVVIQPWTEHPDIATDATGLSRLSRRNMAFAKSLLNIQNLAAHLVTQGDRLSQINAISRTSLKHLSFLGETNIANKSAVKRLKEMGTKHAYVHYGSRSGLENILPGVNVAVLGPPTLEQSETIKSQVSDNPAEFWQLQANALYSATSEKKELFPNSKKYTSRSIPSTSRWLIDHAQKAYVEQLLGIVRILDRVLNNTSVILVFEVGNQKLLFSGDAQIENWSYALFGSDGPTNQSLLEDVSLYKVGHHGSRNATPKTLWDLFKNRSGNENEVGRLKTSLSTMKGKHGKSANKTEVPRETLVEALTDESNLTRTDRYRKNELFKEEILYP